MTLHTSRIKRGQAGVIGGIIILAILFSIAIPLILTYQKGSQAIVSNVAEKVNVAYERFSERLVIRGIPATTENLLADLVPGIYVNNTGTTPATLKRIWLLYSNGTIYKIIDLSNYGGGEIDRIVLNPGTSHEELISPGRLPTLQPGEVLLIKFNIPFEIAENLVVKVETTRSVIHPRMGETGYQQLIPPVETTAGAEVQTLTAWRGVYTPVSGFILQGYDDIMKSCIVSQFTPPLRVTTIGTNSKDSLGFERWFILDDPEYPGFYWVGVKVIVQGWSNGRIRFYDSEAGAWDEFPVPNGWWLVLKGFLGTFSTGEVSGRVAPLGAVLLDGWAYKIQVYDPTMSYLLWEYDGGGSRKVSGTYYKNYDMDSNGIPELYTYTDEASNADEFSVEDFGGLPGIYDDVLVTKIEVARDITGVDAIEVYVKINYDLYFYGTGLRIVEKLRTAVVAIEKLNTTTGLWQIVGFKDFEYIEFGPKQVVFGNVFPVERNGIYRVAIFLYDPFGNVPLGSVDSRDYGAIEFYQALEHIIVQLSVNNPYLPVTPPVYILAIPDVNFSYLGGANVSVLNDMLSRVELLLRSMGISSYVVIDTLNKMQEIIFENTPKNAIIINLHGGTIPLPQASLSKLYELRTRVEENGILWVQPIIGMPRDPATPTSDAEWFLADGAIVLSFTADEVLQQFTGITSLDLAFLTDELGYLGVNSNLTNTGRVVRAKYIALELPDTTETLWTVVGVAPIVNLTYYEYIQGDTKYPTIATYWFPESTQKAAILIQGLGQISWTTPQEGETTPDLVAATTIYFALYTWTQIHTSG